MDGRTVSYSRITITELMIPAYANFGGKIHGGVLLSLMDKVAYACASKHAGNYCVTVSVDTVNFLQPVEVGDLVSLKASVNYVGNSSLVVGISVIAEDVRTATVKHTNTSYFTMVAKSDDNEKAIVPPLILEGDDDIRRFLAALKRKRLRSYAKGKMDAYQKEFKLDDAVLSILDDQRCSVSLG
ncbi:MAG: acyl-CoA thioesterase [Halioglobus sp.]